MFEIDPAALTAFFKVVFIDVVLAGDNAVVIGMAAMTVPSHLRRRVIILGLGVAVIFRIAFALGAIQLLAIVGLQLAGGLLLLWVAWKLYRGIVDAASEHAVTVSLGEDALPDSASPPPSIVSALVKIAIADLSMSIDNVLAVAGAAYAHPRVMVVGLVLSIILTGIGATIIAKLLDRYRWLSWAGLLLIVFVALTMILHGGGELAALAIH